MWYSGLLQPAFCAYLLDKNMSEGANNVQTLTRRDLVKLPENSVTTILFEEGIYDGTTQSCWSNIEEDSTGVWKTKQMMTQELQ